MNEEDVVKVLRPEDFKVECKDAKLKKGDLKRQRCENWSEVDKELIKKRVRDIENKNTDTNTNQMEKKAWLDIEKDFNSLCSCQKRTAFQLKSQWSTIKMQAKKEVAEYRAKAKQTGGGQAPTEVTLSGNDISVWLPNEFVIDTNEYDSDVFMIENETNYENCETTLEINLDDGKEKLKDPEQKEAEHTDKKIKPHQKKKLPKEKSNVADENILKIANADVECRKELHLLQIEAEKKRIRNLDLEYELIQARINFYKKISLDNIEI